VAGNFRKYFNHWNLFLSPWVSGNPLTQQKIGVVLSYRLGSKFEPESKMFIEYVTWKLFYPLLQVIRNQQLTWSLHLHRLSKTVKVVVERVLRYTELKPEGEANTPMILFSYGRAKGKYPSPM